MTTPSQFESNEWDELGVVMPPGDDELSRWLHLAMATDVYHGRAMYMGADPAEADQHLAAEVMLRRIATGSHVNLAGQTYDPLVFNENLLGIELGE